MAEIHKLPGVDSTPITMAAMLQSYGNEIESMVVIVKWKSNGARQVCYTAQPISELASSALAAHHHAIKQLTEG